MAIFNLINYLIKSIIICIFETNHYPKCYPKLILSIGHIFPDIVLLQDLWKLCPQRAVKTILLSIISPDAICF